MDGDVCKIKQILELNASEFDENFIQFLLHDSQNLKQLSKLINALEKVKAFSNHASLIHEPSRAKPDGVFELGAEIDLETYSKTNAEIDEKQLFRIDAIITSMTKEERRNPKILNAKRRIRIANGSGNKVEDINRFMNQFEQMQKMMKQFSKGGMGKLMRGMKGMIPGMR